MHNSIQLVGADGGFLLAGDLEDGFDFYDVVYLCKVHVALTKDKPLQVYHEDLWQ